MIRYLTNFSKENQTYPYCFKTYTTKAPKQCKSHYSCSNINSLSMLSQIQVFIFWVNNILDMILREDEMLYNMNIY